MNCADNYRDISTGTKMSRILAKLIMDRSKTAYKIHIRKQQFGFRQNCSTSDALFKISMTIQQY